ncbi:proline--tRNA ligase [candidate division WOR-3 bacterium JGI_Cruoil_03_51_56]|uniref:Proline--tRNA ligase n=1 Tax=candidate division WOR-3 bacterium JGI_Cruoil_03_51_56 TaxID=1973747 RepID=A0A235BTQ7_UNCW3|nr:MAG: proline--tRNA ligase [candidate division WOR-3 bacterium JGI_Cruoil_03_51_56]
MKNNGMVKEIPSRTERFSDWYTAIVLKAELADYAPVRGCMVIRPYGYALWENMKERLDRRFKATGHTNAYFPMLIPEGLLKKEAEHVEGFAPQVAWVTHGGDNKLTERFALRPTSEAIINTMYAKWVKSYRDLPVLINQWCNIVRWEKATRLFLRTMEFLWQEGHTLHRTQDEAQEEARRILDIYVDFVENDLAIPVLSGLKPESEKFPGALTTYTIEAMMPDGQALQAGTSHNLGQHFSEAFDIRFLDKDNIEKRPWGTSWGVSTRLIGGLIMTHGDDRGLFLPPRVAPIQAVIVPILFGKNDDMVLAKCHDALKALEGLRIRLDDRKNQTAGWKFNQYEMMGVPVRIEIGPKDVKKDEVVLVPRDGSAKRSVKFTEIMSELEKLLDQIQNNMLEQARQHLAQMTSEASSIEEFKKKLIAKPGFIRVHWCGSQKCEDKLIDETKTTPRVMVLDEQGKTKGKCICCGKETDTVIYYARTY